MAHVKTVAGTRRAHQCRGNHLALQTEVKVAWAECVDHVPGRNTLLIRNVAVCSIRNEATSEWFKVHACFQLQEPGCPGLSS